MGEETIADGQGGRIQRNPVLSALRDQNAGIRALREGEQIVHLFFSSAACHAMSKAGADSEIKRFPSRRMYKLAWY